MGADFTSFQYPYVTKYQDDGSDENHNEPASEDLQSNATTEHPLFSSDGLKKVINRMRSFGNAPKEKLLTGDIKDQTIKDLLNAALKHQFPFEMLAFAADIKQKLDDRSGASDAAGFAQSMTQYAQQLKDSLGRQPLNSEVFMAHMLGGAGQVKNILEKAKNAPDEIATPTGSEYDDLIFFKEKFGEKVERTNKEAYQFFKKRMQLGNDVFPHLPLGKDRYGTN